MPMLGTPPSKAPNNKLAPKMQTKGRQANSPITPPSGVSTTNEKNMMKPPNNTNTKANTNGK
jgi:hypothetical protein